LPKLNSNLKGGDLMIKSSGSSKDVKTYNKKIIEIIKAKLRECETPDDFFDLLEFADDFLEDEDEQGNELVEPRDIRELILRTFLIRYFGRV
jgi:hypothetical protein